MQKIQFFCEGSPIGEAQNADTVDIVFEKGHVKQPRKIVAITCADEQTVEIHLRPPLPW
jgi:hypothetical protein